MCRPAMTEPAVLYWTPMGQVPSPRGVTMQMSRGFPPPVGIAMPYGEAVRTAIEEFDRGDHGDLVPWVEVRGRYHDHPQIRMVYNFVRRREATQAASA